MHRDARSGRLTAAGSLQHAPVVRAVLDAVARLEELPDRRRVAARVERAQEAADLVGETGRLVVAADPIEMRHA
jgi:hypothetical protein